MIDRTCEQCGSSFAVYPSDLARPGSGRFCSRSCKSRWFGDRARKPLAGLRFGFLVVVALDATRGDGAVWLCRCDCGTERSIPAKSLVSGNSTSCGCAPERGPKLESLAPGDEGFADSFWARVDKTAPEPAHVPGLGGCWVWIGASTAWGYGQLRARRELYIAHRVGFFLGFGRWPEPFCLHKCDNPPCVRPDHLFEGTIADNTADMMRKGCHRHGSGRHRAATESS